jgi:hypothetical protein
LEKTSIAFGSFDEKNGQGHIMTSHTCDAVVDSMG